MSELIAIVSSFNRKPLLERAVSSLLSALARSGISAEIVVFEAGSTDGSHEFLLEVQSQARIPIHITTPSGQNNSFSAGVNAAASCALKNFPETKYLLLFETDNVLLSSVPLVSAHELLSRHDSLAAAGFTTRKDSGAPAGFGCSLPSIAQFLLGPQLSNLLKLDAPRLEWRTDEIGDWSFCDVVYTSPILIKREVWERTGGFDCSSFPFSDCDLDWALRLRALGLRQAVLNTREVIHDNQEQISNWSAARVLHFHRARLQLLGRHNHLVRVAIYPLLSVRHLLELLVLAVRIGHGREYGKSLRKRWLLLTRVFCGYEMK